MRCPHCGAEDNRVVDSRLAEHGAAIRRRRHCRPCDQRFSTYERAEQSSVLVRKRDGSLQPYERQKVLDGMRRALGSDVDGTTVRRAAEQVEERLRELGPRQVASSTVGAEVLAALRTLSPPAAIRFASVHKQFTSVDDFRRELELTGDEGLAHLTSTIEMGRGEAGRGEAGRGEEATGDGDGLAEDPAGPSEHS